MSIVSATDTNNTTHITGEVSQNVMLETQEITQKTSETTISDDNSNVIKENNEDKQAIQNIIKKDKTDEKVKTDDAEDNVTVVNITSSNFKQYFTVMSNVAYMGKGITSTNNSLVLNVKYVPSNVYIFSLEENSNKFQNLSLVIDGHGCNALTNVGFKLSTNFKTVTLENFDSTITESYTKNDYLTLTGTNGTYIIRNMTIDVQKPDLTTYVFRVEKQSLIENCNLKACLSECNIDWDSSPYLPDCIGFYVKTQAEIRNNNIEILITGNKGGSYYSSYAAFLGRSGIKFINNTLISTNCTADSGYSYGLVVRSSNNIIKDNKIYITSHTYTAGIHLEMATFKNNIVEGNYINVTSSYGNAPWGNIAVAYAINLLDFQYTGNLFGVGGNHPNNNSIIRNTLVGEAAQIYGVEMYGGYNTNISENNITLFGRTCMGIGVIGANTTANNNNIIVIGEHNLTEGTADYLKATTAGLYTYLSDTGIEFKNNIIYSENAPGIILEKVYNVIVQNNLIYSEGHDYTISLEGNNNNTVIDNILEARNNRGDSSVSGQINNIVENNTYPIEPTITVTNPEKIIKGIQTQFTIKICDDENNVLTNKTIIIKVNNDENQEFITDNEGTVTYNFIPENAGTNTLTITSAPERNLMETTYTNQFDVKDKIILTPENFNTYITDGILNDNIANGTYIDVQGKFDDEKYVFNITKPVNMYSSSGDAFFCFYSTPTSESGSELPHNSFVITKEGSGTNVSDIYFENTEILVLNAHDVILDNLTVYCTEGYGWGRGSTSIRNSNHVTVKNSYFNTTNNNGVSTVVFAASQDSRIENCTVTGSGFIGNLVYATTYNVDVTDEYGNNNITIINNKIIARDLSPGIATCYSVCVIGDNITVENNYIENSNNFLIMTQYKDDAYEVEGTTGGLTIRNNSFGPGKISVSFDPCTITDNTFYANVTLDVTNTTIKENNIQKDANENPYMNMNTAQEHDATVKIESPTSYIYNEEIPITVTITDTNYTKAFLEVYADGELYKKITLDNTQTVTFNYSNKNIGTHHIRVWYYPEGKTVSNSQKLLTLEAQKISGQLNLETKENPEIGETITLKVTYTLNRNINHKANITFELPGQKPITITAENNTATLKTTIITDYIRDILGGREQNIKITATTNDTNVEITGINTKLGVTKTTTNITITPNKSKIGETTTITATINTPYNTTLNTGTITFTDANGNTIATQKVQNNKATTKITFNTTGTTQITATYSGTVHYQETQNTGNIQIEKYNTQITLNIKDKTEYTEQITITGTLTDENKKPLTNTTIKLNINNQEHTLTTDNQGTYTYTTLADKVGDNTIKVEYAGNNNYNPSTIQKTFTVNKLDTKLTLNNILSTQYTNNVTITGTLKDANEKPLKQEIKLNINSNEHTLTTDNQGTFKYTTTADKVGNNNITITYNGNTNYNPSTIQKTFTVNKLDTKLTLNNIPSTQYTNNITITGTLKDAKNNNMEDTTVTITINTNKYTTKTDKTGTYKYTTTTDKTGTNTIKIEYAGNNNYNPSTASTTFTVNKLDTKLTLNNIPSTQYTNNVTITGTLEDENEKPLKQEIKLNINSKEYTLTTDNQGTFKYIVLADKVGSNNITITYNGNVNYNPSTIQKTFLVTKLDTQSTISSISTTQYTDTATITGKLTDKNGKTIPNTNLNLNINGKTTTVKTNNKGIYSYNYKTNTIGTNNVTITYNGNANYNPSTTQKTFTVTKIKTNITINNIKASYSDNITITGKLTDKNGKTIPNMNIKLNLNGKTVTIKTDKKGIFTYKNQTNKVGNNNLTITYKGNTKYTYNTTKTTFKVKKLDLKLTINKIKSVAYLENITIKGTFKDKNGKILGNSKVKININGKNKYVKTNTKGIYTYTTRATKPGNITVTVSHNGNKNYNKITTKTTVIIKKQNLKITSNVTPKVGYGSKVYIKGKLTDKHGKIIKNTVITININGKIIRSKTNSKGIYNHSLTTTKLGTNNITISYKGSKNYNPLTKKTTFKVTKQTVKIRITSTKQVTGTKKVKITGKLTTKDNKALRNSVVTLTINGKNKKAKTNTNGIFTLTVTAKKGNNTLIPSFAANKYYNKYTGTKKTFTIL